MRNIPRPTRPSRPHLAEILIRYRNEVVPTHRGAKYELHRVKQLLGHPVSQNTMLNLTPAKIAYWCDERLRTVSAGSVLREMTILRSAIRHARTEWGIELRDHPMTHVAKPKDKPPRERRISHTPMPSHIHWGGICLLTMTQRAAESHSPSDQPRCMKLRTVRHTI